jgi:hypothetical protein
MKQIVAKQTVIAVPVVRLDGQDSTAAMVLT